MERRPETERPRMGYPPQSQPSIYFGERAFKPAVEPAVPRSPSTHAKPIEELSGAARVPVADDWRHAYPATYKAMEFIRSRAPHLLQQTEDAARTKAQAGTAGPHDFPVGASELWDRTPIGPPSHVGARQHIPLLKLTPDVTILLASIAAEVTSEANEARRLRALEGAAEESGDEDDDRSSSLRFYRRAHLAGVLSARDVEFDDYEDAARITCITLEKVRDPRESNLGADSTPASAVVIEASVMEENGGEDSDDDEDDDEKEKEKEGDEGNVDAVAARLDEAAWRGGSADDLLYARCSKRVGLRPAAMLPMQAAAALVHDDDDDVGCAAADDDAELLAVTAAMQLPNVTFRLTPIEIPRGVAPVPLAMNLERLQRRWNAEAENRSRRIVPDVDECASGFLTLDGAKRLVPIADVDPRAFEVPVVGVWYAGAGNPEHLGVWSAMLRYAARDDFKRKSTRGADGSFLLAMYPPPSGTTRACDPGRPNVYDVVTVPGTTPFSRFVARVRCSPGEAGEAPFVSADSEATRHLVSPLNRSSTSGEAAARVNQRYATIVPDDDEDDDDDDDDLDEDDDDEDDEDDAFEASSDVAQPPSSVSPITEYRYPPRKKDAKARKARKAISPPEASPGKGLGKIRPSTRYEATARRVAALRRTAVASLRASVNRGDESAFFVPSARASLVAKRGYYGVADEVVREQQRQITELAAAVRALRAEIAAAGGGGANGGGGVRPGGTGELLAAVAVDVPARGSPESPPNEAPKYAGSDANPADVEAEADAEEERTKESEVVKPEESSDDEGPEVELKTPSPEPELTEKERRRLEKLARKETKRAEREEKKAKREGKKAEREEKKAKREEKKSLHSRDRAADDDEPVFEDDSEDVSEDAPTPSPEPTIAPKMSKERKPRVTAEMEAEHLDDVELEETSSNPEKPVEPEPPEGCPEQPPRTQPRGVDPYVELESTTEVHGSRWADPMPGLHDPDGPHPSSPELEFVATGIPLEQCGGVDADATDSEEDESIVRNLQKAQLMTLPTDMDDETAKRKAAANDAFTVGKVANSADFDAEASGDGFHAILSQAIKLDLDPMYPMIEYVEDGEGSGDEDEEIMAKYLAAGIEAKAEGEDSEGEA